MKKLILLSLLCLAANTSLLGQIGKGSVTVRGGAELDYLFAEEETRTGFSYDFFPRFGLMVTDHWMVGAGVSIRGFGNNVYPSEVAPEIRYYINPRSDTWIQNVKPYQPIRRVTLNIHIIFTICKLQALTDLLANLNQKR